jgi:hypothetical protein
MKTINNYINERLNPRHLGSVENFPVDSTIDEVAEFLKRRGFSEIDFSTDTTDTFNSNPKKKVFMKRGLWIRFADMSKGSISKSNPIFYYGIRDIYNTSYYFIEYSNDSDEKLTEKEFLKMTSKYFGF